MSVGAGEDRPRRLTQRDSPGRHRLVLLLGLEPAIPGAHSLVGQGLGEHRGAGVHPEGVEYVLVQELGVGGAAGVLGRQPRYQEHLVVVEELLAERCHGFGHRQLANHVLDGQFFGAVEHGVGARHPCPVTEEVAQGDLLVRLRILQVEVGHVLADWIVEVDLPFRREPGDQHSGERLRDGADLEDRLRSDRPATLEVGHTDTAGEHTIRSHHGESHAGDVVFACEAFQRSTRRSIRDATGRLLRGRGRHEGQEEAQGERESRSEQRSQRQGTVCSLS